MRISAAKRAATLKRQLYKALMKIRNIEYAEDKAIEKVKSNFQKRVFKAKAAYYKIDYKLQMFYRQS